MNNVYLVFLALVICAVLVAPGMFITMQKPTAEKKEAALSDELLTAITDGSTRTAVEILNRKDFHPTLLHLAQSVNAGNDTLVALLLRTGEFDINAHYQLWPNNPPLLGIAAAANRSSTVFLLLAYPGIRANERDDDGITPLGLAIRASRSKNFPRYDAALVLMADPRTDFAVVSQSPPLDAVNFANRAHADANLIRVLSEKRSFKSAHALPGEIESRLKHDFLTDAPPLTQEDINSFIGVWKYSKFPDYHIVIYKGMDGSIYASLKNWGGDGLEKPPQPISVKDNIIWLPYGVGTWIKLSKLDTRPKPNILKYTYFGTETDEYIERIQ